MTLITRPISNILPDVFLTNTNKLAEAAMVNKFVAKIFLMEACWAP